MGLGLGVGFEQRGDLCLLSEDLRALDLKLLELCSELLVGVRAGVRVRINLAVS